MPDCKYCKTIKEKACRYKVKKAVRDLKSDWPRCELHWRFVCDRCGRHVHFHGMSWCGKTGEFFCVHCAPRHRKAKKKFWEWDYYYDLWCDKCKKHHGALDWLEYKGKHPWLQGCNPSTRRRRSLRAGVARGRRGLSEEKETGPRFWMRWKPGFEKRPSQSKVKRSWDGAAAIWDSGYDGSGDSYRKHIMNPALLSMMGKVKGKVILDAGCGNGYMSRILAEKGAKMTGVDLSSEFIALAKRYEKKKPLGIKYYQGDLAKLGMFSSRQFDLAVSVYVVCDVREAEKAIKEIARVLKPKGRFLFLFSHPCFSWKDGGWRWKVNDSQRDEDAEFIMNNYPEEGVMEVQWGQLPVLYSFQRTLTTYFGYLKDNGFVVQDLLEPRPKRETLNERPRDWQREDRIPPVIIIDAVKRQVVRS